MEQERHGKKRRFHEFLENYYELSKNGTDVKIEIIAGMTTFLTMAYVLAVIPGFLKEAGIPEGGLYTAVCLIAMTGTLMHALFSKLPVATAPGLGLTVFLFRQLLEGWDIHGSRALRLLLFQVLYLCL